MSKVTIDSLPLTVPATETLARNRALWPQATADKARDCEQRDEEEEKADEGRKE